MTILDLVTRATTTAFRAGITKVTPNSHKANIKSVVKASYTIANDMPVPKPTRLPVSQTLIAFLTPGHTKKATLVAFLEQNSILTRDFEALASVSERNCLKMHSVMWSSRPPIVYWNSATLDCLQTVRSLQAEGHGVFFTIDAGPQVKAICLPESRQVVHDALVATNGVIKAIRSKLGPPARLIS